MDIDKQKISWICSCCNEHQESEKEYASYPYNISDLSISCKNTKVTNPFSREEAELTPLEEAAYALIMGAQIAAGDTYFYNSSAQKIVRVGLDWFREYHAESYMKLLD